MTLSPSRQTQWLSVFNAVPTVILHCFRKRRLPVEDICPEMEEQENTTGQQWLGGPKTFLCFYY